MKRILIIDDDSDVCKLLQDTLKTEGYEVEVALDGNEAKKLFKMNPFELAIVDMLLPDCSGAELIKQLWRYSQKLKIIAISGGGKLGPKGYINIAKRIGVEHTFAKPFDFKDLIRTVNNLFE